MPARSTVGLRCVQLEKAEYTDQPDSFDFTGKDNLPASRMARKHNSCGCFERRIRVNASVRPLSAGQTRQQPTG